MYVSFTFRQLLFRCVSAATDTKLMRSSIPFCLLFGHTFDHLQVPLVELRSDGRTNLVDSLMIAGEYIIPEVHVYVRTYLLYKL